MASKLLFDWSLNVNKLCLMQTSGDPIETSIVLSRHQKRPLLFFFLKNKPELVVLNVVFCCFQANRRWLWLQELGGITGQRSSMFVQVPAISVMLASKL